MIKIDADGYRPFSMFGGSGGEAQFLVNNTELPRYVGIFRSSEPLPEDNQWALDVDEYLYVIEGEISIEFVNNGKSAVVGAGEMAFLPCGSVVHLTLSKLPYSESFVMIAPSA